jgi:hypothetical protein
VVGKVAEVGFGRETTAAAREMFGGFGGPGVVGLGGGGASIAIWIRSRGTSYLIARKGERARDSTTVCISGGKYVSISTDAAGRCEHWSIQILFPCSLTLGTDDTHDTCTSRHVAFPGDFILTVMLAVRNLRCVFSLFSLKYTPLYVHAYNRHTEGYSKSILSSFASSLDH